MWWRNLMAGDANDNDDKDLLSLRASQNCWEEGTKKIPFIWPRSLNCGQSTGCTLLNAIGAYDAQNTKTLQIDAHQNPEQAYSL